MFLNADGTAPVSAIRPAVISVVKELTGQVTPPHLFRSIMCTHLYNEANGQEDLLESLANAMATSVATLKKHYLLPDRLKSSAKAQAAIDRLLSTDVPETTLRVNKMDTAKLNFSRRLRQDVKPVRATQNGKRVRLAWTAQEEAALVRGVQQFGEGCWSRIVSDSELGKYLASRTNVDLKDKWRSLSKESNAKQAEELDK